MRTMSYASSAGGTSTGGASDAPSGSGTLASGQTVRVVPEEPTESRRGSVELAEMPSGTALAEQAQS
jgi:hypothetical protein